MAIYVASGQLSRGIAAATLRYATAMGIWDLIPCRLGKRGTPSGRSKFVPITQTQRRCRTLKSVVTASVCPNLSSALLTSCRSALPLQLQLRLIESSYW
ncbi:unnamed protein product [Brassica oleracea var. botrytis]